MRTLIAIVLVMSCSTVWANSMNSAASMPEIMGTLKQSILKLKNAKTLEQGIRLVGNTRSEAQLDEVFDYIKEKSGNESPIHLNRAVFFSNKVHLTFGSDTVVFEVVNANTGEFKINNKKLQLTPHMTYKEVFDSVGKLLGRKTAGIPFIIPSANAGFFKTLLAIAGIGIAAISVVDLLYIKTHRKNKKAIHEAAAQCEGYVELQKVGNAPASTPTSVRQLEQLLFAFKDVKDAQCGSGVSYILRASLVKAIYGACGAAKQNVKCLETYSKNKSNIDPDLIKLMLKKLAAVKPAWTNQDQSNNSNLYVARAQRIEKMGPSSRTIRSGSLISGRK